MIIMGGAIYAPGNETACAETNIAFDPDAAAYVFANCRGVKTNIIPLDVTREVFWDKNDIRRIPEDKPHKIWIKNMLLAWFTAYGGKQESVFHLHDPLAVYAIRFPNELEWIKSGIKITTAGVARGQMILDKNHPPCRVALGVRRPAYVARRIFDIAFTGN